MAVVGEFGQVKREQDKARTGEVDTIVFFGETFTIADSVGFMPLMSFAHAASSGLDTNDMAGMKAMRDMLRDCLAEGEWPRFEECSTVNKADAELLMAVTAKVYEVVAARPTESPTGSPDGQSSATPSSNSSASLRASLGLVPVEQAMGLTG